ncbi:hypothetical protein QJS56_07140 [Bacillus altitudinis]|nr:hypothetical protein QJS56_07140 [Bacillus altitudinis]
MGLSELIKQNEKIFKGAIDIKYYFVPSDEPIEYLLVGFSGFNGKEENGEPPRYNYVKQLKDFPCNKLFILDDLEGNPCYYLGKNKSLEYETTVIALITYIANKYNISMKKIIAFGTSKGGTSALYFTMKYRFGHVIAGGMQTKVGDYLYKISDYTRNKLLTTITGETPEYGRDYLNSFYSNIFDYPHQDIEYNIHGGSGDYHYLTYVKPFLENLEKLNIYCNVDIAEYSDHGEIGTYFTKFLFEQITRITGKVIIKENSLKKDNNKLIVSCKVSEHLKKDKSMRYAFYFLKDKDIQPVEKIPYSHSTFASFTPQEEGNYRVRIYAKNANGITKVTTKSVFFSKVI